MYIWKGLTGPTQADERFTFLLDVTYATKMPKVA